MWAKVWAFQGMLKMGTYDTVNDAYSTRNSKTINPFIKANPAIIAKCIETIAKLVNKEEITDEEEARLSKTRSFNKLYTFFEKRYKKDEIEHSDPNDGIWIKYNRGKKDEAIKLSKSVQGTNWCTASEEMAISQLCGPYAEAPLGGDFYVYYTKDREGKYTLPRVAIRLNGHTEIGEIRGILDGQNLELELAETVGKKLNSMPFISRKSIKKNMEIVDILRNLSVITKKTHDGVKLTEDELITLYTKGVGFGWGQGQTVDRIIALRNVVDDYNSTNNKNVKIAIVLLRRLPEKFVTDGDVMIKALDEGFRYSSWRKKDNIFLKYISDKLMTDEKFLLEAAKVDPRLIKFVSEDKIELIWKNLLKLIEEYPGYVFINLPKSIILSHPELALEAVKRNSYLLKEVPQELFLKKPRIVVEALKLDGIVIRDIPKEIIEKKPSYALIAAKSAGTSIRYLDKEFLIKHPKVVFAAVKKDGQALKYIPDELIKDYPELVKTAIKNDGDLITMISKSFLETHPELMLEALTAKYFNNKYNPPIKYRIMLIEKWDYEGHIKGILYSHPEYVTKAETIRTIKNIKLKKNLKESIHRLVHISGLRGNLNNNEYTKTK